LELKNKNIVVTGAASGIGRALAHAFTSEGARVVISDRDHDRMEETASEIGAKAMTCDVKREQDIQELVAFANRTHGPVDLFCSNAGICRGEPGNAASADNSVWQACWDIHVMAHVYAARAVLPDMIERGGGYLLQVASAAGLLSQIGDAAYSASKHAAVGFAESLAISHGDDGIRVSVLCPQYVATPMLGVDDQGGHESHPGLLTPEQVAETTLQGIQDERFLILPHPEVEQYLKFKAADHDRWLSGMRKLRRKIVRQTGSTRLQEMYKLV